MDAHEDPRTTAQLAVALERAITEINYTRSVDLIGRLRLKIAQDDEERAVLRQKLAQATDGMIQIHH